MRLIDADTLKEEIEYYIQEAGWDEAHNEALEWCLEFIDNQTTIEPERKTGQWIPLQLSMAHPPYQCSCCFGNAPMVETGCLENRYIEALLTPYCPNCGVKMERR